MYYCFSIHATGVSLILYFYCKVSSKVLHCVIMRPIYTGHEESGCVYCFSIHAVGVRSHFDSLFPPQSITRNQDVVLHCVIMRLHAVGVSLILYFHCKVSSEVLHCVIMRLIYTGQEESECVLLFLYTCSWRISLILCFYCKVSSEVLHCVIMRPIYTGQEESGCVYCFSIHAVGVSLILYFYCKVSPEALHCGIYNETYIHRSGGIWICIVVFLYMQWA